MKIKITRDCAIGGEHIEAGTVLDLQERDAISIINMGKGQPDEIKKKSDDRSVGLDSDNSAALIKRSRKTKK